MSSFRRRNGLILGLFTLLALALTWPLLRHITTHVPGSDTWAYDEYTFIWSMWHFQHSLFAADSAIFFSQNIFYPLGMELILYSYNLLAAILALPLGLASNWAFAANITLLFSAIVSGFGAYLLASWVLRTGIGYLILGIGYWVFSCERHYPIPNIQYRCVAPTTPASMSQTPK